MLLHINICIQPCAYQENTTNCEDTFLLHFLLHDKTLPDKTSLVSVWSSFRYGLGQELSSQEENWLQQGQLSSCIFSYGPKLCSCGVCRSFPPLGHTGGSHTNTSYLRHDQPAHSRPSKNLSKKPAFAFGNELDRAER